jgi:hypothetical protein
VIHLMKLEKKMKTSMPIAGEIDHLSNLETDRGSRAVKMVVPTNRSSWVASM